jgi:hypothetical protein
VSADNDGKQTAFITVTVQPPANSNWAKLVAQATGHHHQRNLSGGAQGFQRPGVRGRDRWDAAESPALDRGLGTECHQHQWCICRRFQLHELERGDRAAPPTISVQQKTSFFADLDIGAIADVAGSPKFRDNVLFEKIGAGAFTEKLRTADRQVHLPVTHGTAYQWKAHAEDLVGNETADSNTVSLTPGSVRLTIATSSPPA